MGDTPNIVAWTVAVCGAVGTLVASVVAAYIGFRKSDVEVRREEKKLDMEEQQYNDTQAGMAYALLIKELTARVSTLESMLGMVTQELKVATAAHSRCEVETEKIRGDFRVQSEQLKLMQFQLDRLMKHEANNQAQLETVKEAISQVVEVK